MRIIYLVSIISFFISCNKYSEGIQKALDQAEENRSELEKVLKFYASKPSDSLKYKAAVFLIENMIYRSSYQPLYSFDEAFDRISNYPMNNLRREVFEEMLDSASQSMSKQNPEIILDIKHLNSDFLINNIELAFKAWYKIPEDKRASFNEFCRYILPYKNASEPIGPNARKRFFEKYSWVYDSLKKGIPLKTIVDTITSRFGYINMVQLSKFYPLPLSINQVEKSRLGLCDDGVNYFVTLFRSLGIVSAKDMILHWGNHHVSGHSWIYVKYGKEKYSTDVGGSIDLKNKYIGESIPKVNRIEFLYRNNLSFLPFATDVTKEYIPTIDVDIEFEEYIPESKPVLCVFDVSKEWIPIAFGTVSNEVIKYKDIGTNVLYLAAFVKDKIISPINYPFFVNEAGNIHVFDPINEILDSVIIERKYGLSTARNKTKLKWIKNINGGVFQGADNQDFINAKILHQISGFNSTHPQKKKVESSKKFKYIRFYSNEKESFLAKLAFYDKKGNLLSGKVIKENNMPLKWKNGAFDDNPLTFSGGLDFTLGWELSEPKNVSHIVFQVRNDDNHINIGEKYELFYWNKRWVSLGKQQATDTVLYYDVPANSLFWLKNLTKGKEEHVFTINKHKRQQWLGFDNY